MGYTVGKSRHCFCLMMTHKTGNVWMLTCWCWLQPVTAVYTSSWMMWKASREALLTCLPPLSRCPWGCLPTTAWKKSTKQPLTSGYRYLYIGHTPHDRYHICVLCTICFPHDIEKMINTTHYRYLNLNIIETISVLCTVCCLFLLVQPEVDALLAGPQDVTLEPHSLQLAAIQALADKGKVQVSPYPPSLSLQQYSSPCSIIMIRRKISFDLVYMATIMSLLFGLISVRDAGHRGTIPIRGIQGSDQRCWWHRGKDRRGQTGDRWWAFRHRVTVGLVKGWITMTF